MSRIDPVLEAREYQQMLLGLLGEDDPAAVQRETSVLWRALLTDVTAQLRTRPAEGEWSIIELLGHAADAELVVGGRLRWILSQDEPVLMPYDQAQWVSALDHQSAEPTALMDLFEALRRANLRLWEGSTVPQRARIGLHQERGPESFELTFRLLAGHDRFHLEQARRTLAELR